MRQRIGKHFSNFVQIRFADEKHHGNDIQDIHKNAIKDIGKNVKIELIRIYVMFVFIAFNYKLAIKQNKLYFFKLIIAMY